MFSINYEVGGGKYTHERTQTRKVKMFGKASEDFLRSEVRALVGSWRLRLHFKPSLAIWPVTMWGNKNCLSVLNKSETCLLLEKRFGFTTTQRELRYWLTCSNLYEKGRRFDTSIHSRSLIGRELTFTSALQTFRIGRELTFTSALQTFRMGRELMFTSALQTFQTFWTGRELTFTSALQTFPYVRKQKTDDHDYQ